MYCMNIEYRMLPTMNSNSNSNSNLIKIPKNMILQQQLKKYFSFRNVLKLEAIILYHDWYHGCKERFLIPVLHLLYPTPPSRCKYTPPLFVEYCPQRSTVQYSSFYAANICPCPTLPQIFFLFLFLSFSFSLFIL